VVGRLVEEEVRGAGEKESGERDPHAPAAGERSERPVDLRAREAEPREHALGLGAHPVAVGLLEEMLEVAEPAEQRRELGMPLGEARDLLGELHLLALDVEHCLKGAERRSERRLAGQRDLLLR